MLGLLTGGLVGPALLTAGLGNFAAQPGVSTPPAGSILTRGLGGEGLVTRGYAASGIVVPLPLSLVQAIGALWDAQGFADVAGPLFNNRAPAGLAPPMTVLKVKRGTPYLLTSTSRFFDQTATFRIRSDDADACHAAAILVDAAIDDAGLEWDGGWTGPATRMRWDSDAEPKPSVGPQVHYDELEYSFRTRGPR